jgi:hypothetical protein
MDFESSECLPTKTHPPPALFLVFQPQPARPPWNSRSTSSLSVKRRLLQPSIDSGVIVMRRAGFAMTDGRVSHINGERLMQDNILLSLRAGALPAKQSPLLSPRGVKRRLLQPCIDPKAIDARRSGFAVTDGRISHINGEQLIQDDRRRSLSRTKNDERPPSDDEGWVLDDTNGEVEKSHVPAVRAALPDREFMVS